MPIRRRIRVVAFATHRDLLKAVGKDAVGIDRDLIAAHGRLGVSGIAHADRESGDAHRRRHAAEHAGHRIQRQATRWECAAKDPARSSARTAVRDEGQRVWRADETVRQRRRIGDDEGAVVVDDVAEDIRSDAEQRCVEIG